MLAVKTEFCLHACFVGRYTVYVCFQGLERRRIRKEHERGEKRKERERERDKD